MSEKTDEQVAAPEAPAEGQNPGQPAAKLKAIALEDIELDDIEMVETKSFA